MTKKKDLTEEPQENLTPVYNELIQGLQLKDIRTQKGSWSFVAKYPSPPKTAMSYNIDKAAEYKLTPYGFKVRSAYVLKATQGQPEKAYAKIECIFIVEYASEKPMTDAIFEIFKDVNLPLNTWPYFREFVEQATCRMGLPSLTLPVFQVFR